MLKVAIPILAVLLVNLNNFTGQTATRWTDLDTLKHPLFKTTAVDQNCSRFVVGYYQKSGILISNYYSVLDSLPVNLNDDNFIDMILVLSPKSLDPIDVKCDFDFDKAPKRVLAEIIKKPKGDAKIRSIYYNVISDVGGVLSHYSGIFLSKNGFKIVHEAGANYSWSYSTEFSIVKGGIGLRRISKTCSYGDKADSVEYTYNLADPVKINIPDTLANQCNCDAVWSKLDK
ncbi:MAG: hypothetical protein BGO21_19965 [Dyadobacter sp. 50-39]|uniref:hypothetical protein n=1 Tax=Dyadobacter sp. 50-39 TaxID=1895756 RepID=UPI00095E5D12|nr:hypothetical protein [Dyadobacter sp. 50-39]OJV14945.1 MAG: hypothetical protein BGO21_19965 [Dyadobacter sp. 50-39]